MNMAHRSEEECSDDEVFFGKLTLKKIKRLISWNHSESNTLTNSPRGDNSTSIKIIETHSQPNLRPITLNSPKFSSAPGSPDPGNRKSDESFIHMENMVSKLCSSPGKGGDNSELNNTLEVMDYILKNGPNKNMNKTDSEKVMEVEKMCSQSPLPVITPKKEVTPRQPLLKKRVDKISAQYSGKKFTPAKRVNKQQVDNVTPSTVNIKTKTPIFKTPATPQNKQLALSLKKTPSKTNAYQHIASPIASYIKNCPQVPLVKDVYPRKPLPGSSSIPKFVRHAPPSKVHNKENINLPSVAYKSAKKTKVITMPDEEKLPQCQWAKKIMSTLPRPTVMKHENREVDLTKQLWQNQQPLEDSFANLSCLQAEVSVCTQKSAFKTNKHY